MPYVERVTKAGNTIEIERYFTSRYKKKGISRGDKVKPTKEEQEKVNTRQAERKLRILINANYGYGDYHLVLDYIRRKGEPDRTPEQMRQDIDVFLRECRKEYRKAGLTELKRQEKQERKKEKYHNTFTLMKCYRDAVFHIENAISDGQQLKLKGMTDEQQRTYLESIRRTRFKTLIMTAHIDKAVEEIERRREAAGRGVEYKAFEMYFMQGMDYAEIAEELDTGKNTPRRWVTGIINELSVLLWGIDEERVK